MEEKVENQEEIQEETLENTPELETVLKENEELKAELEALKANLSEQEETKLEEETQEEENSDAEQIEKIAEDFDIDKETVRKALDSKLTVREFKKQIFNNNNKKDSKTMNTKREFREYLNARDFSKPFSIRDFAGFAPAGLVGTETLPLIQALDKRLGVKGYRAMNGLTSNISIPVQSTRPTVYTPGINEASTDSNPAFEQVTLSPVKFTASTVIGKEVLYNSNSDVESFIVDAILKELSYSIEKHMLAKVADSANTEITYSALNAITWADILAMEAAVDGYLVDNMNFVMSPAARASLKGTPKATDTIAGFICQGNEINGYACNVSGVVGNDNIYFGDWSELVLGTWSGMDIMIDPYTEARSGNLVVVGSILADAAVVQKDAFCIGKVQG